jgi:hypothetical protein
MLSDWFLYANWINILTLSTEGTCWVSAAGLVFVWPNACGCPNENPPALVLHSADGFGVVADRLPLKT